MNKFVIAILILFFTLGCDKSTHKNNPQTEKEDWAMLGFVKADSVNPILKPSKEPVFSCPIGKKEVNWEERNVLNPSALVKDGKVYLIYRAQDMDMTSRLGLAISEDGLRFKKLPDPIFYPVKDNMQQYEWNGGVEDPRIVESEDGTYILTYTAYDGKTARLCIASSKDLKNWTKHGNCGRGHGDQCNLAQ